MDSKNEEGYVFTDVSSDSENNRDEFNNIGEAPSQAEEKRLATWGSEVPDDLVIDQKKLAEALQKEDERRREERDERKRKYNVKWNDEVTPEDMEAFRMKRIHHYNPMKEFLH